MKKKPIFNNKCRNSEQNIKKRLSVASLNDTVGESTFGKPPIAEKPSQLSPRILNDPAPLSAASSSLIGIEKKVEATIIDRGEDQVYLCTTNVVKAVMTLSSCVEKSQTDDYLEMVKKVGAELRSLLGTVDNLSG
jgi:focal adhesion kinase 1